MGGFSTIAGVAAKGVWEYPTRELTRYRMFMPVWYTPSNDMIPGTPYRRLTHVFTAGTSVQSGTGTETTETTRLDFVFLSPIMGKGVVVSWFTTLSALYVYVDSITGWYNYRLYAQLVALKPDGTLVDVSPESLIAGGATREISPAQWMSLYVNAVAYFANINAPFDGMLGLRLRTTSWSTSGGYSGHGLSGLGSRVVAFHVLLEV